MRRYDMLRWLVLAVVLAWSAAIPAAADIGMGEATVGLTNSALWELNRDTAGTLYVSDYALPAVVTVNPTTGAYTRYTLPLGQPFFITPSDAKPGGDGLIWWSDYFSAFGRINPSSGQVLYWELSGLGLQPGGFAFDSSGRLWFTEPYGSRLLRFNPSNNELCRFDVGGGGRYIIAYGGKLWVGDSVARRILRFDPASNQLRWWNLSGSAAPQGLAFDADGRLWWADAAPTAGKLGRLNPDSGEAVTYPLPSGAQPVAVVPGIEVIWYTDESGSAGFLDPARAAGSAAVLSSGTSSPASTCSTVLSGSQTATKASGTFSFATVNWTTVSSTPLGITAYAAPGSSAEPYGMAFSDERTWTVDRVRLTLSRTPRVPRAPTVSISRSGSNMTLSWPPVTQDEGGGAVTVSSYQVWRSGQPYFRPWDSGVTFVGQPAGSPYPVGALPPAGEAAYFVMRSVADSGLLSRSSNRVGAFSFALTPGTP